MPQGAPLSACTAPGPGCVSSCSLTQLLTAVPRAALMLLSHFSQQRLRASGPQRHPFFSCSFPLSGGITDVWLPLPFPPSAGGTQPWPSSSSSSLKAVGAALLMRQCWTSVCATSGRCGHRHGAWSGSSQDGEGAFGAVPTDAPQPPRLCLLHPRLETPVRGHLGPPVCASPCRERRGPGAGGAAGAAGASSRREAAEHRLWQRGAAGAAGGAGRHEAPLVRSLALPPAPLQPSGTPSPRVWGDSASVSQTPLEQDSGSREPAVVGRHRRSLPPVSGVPELGGHPVLSPRSCGTRGEVAAWGPQPGQVKG